MFDLDRTSLGAADETTAARRDAPLVIVGSIQGELSRWVNRPPEKPGTKTTTASSNPTTQWSVIDDDAVPATLAAFYSGAADQELALTQTDGRETDASASPRGTVAEKRRYHSFRGPPFRRIRDN